MAHNALQRLLEHRPLVTAVSIEFAQERVQTEQGCYKQHTAIAILQISGMNDSVEQQTLRVYEKMALLALGLLACVITVRINRRPPFSALFTLWLSMIAAVGLASRSACSRHFT